MKRILFLAAMLLSGLAFADDMVAFQGTDSVRLMDKPCTSAAVLALIPAPLHEQFRAGIGNVGGKEYAACWRMTPGGAHMVYEDGDQGLVPLRDFRRSKGV